MTPGVYQLEVKSTYPNGRAKTAFRVGDALDTSSVQMVVSLDKQNYEIGDAIKVNVDQEGMTVDESLIRRTMTVFLDNKNVSHGTHLFVNGKLSLSIRVPHTEK